MQRTDGYEMLHKAWCSIGEMPYCSWSSSIKFQGHMRQKIADFYLNWAFPDCNSSVNSPMAMKCCTKLETSKKRCAIVFQGHVANFKVTQDKTSTILTQIGRFRTVGRSQLSNPSDLPSSTSSNGNIFRATGPLWGESIGHRPMTRCFDVFCDLRPE